MDSRMSTKVLLLALAVALTGCSTTSTLEGGTDDLGTITINALRAQHRADRAAIKAAGARLRDAFGYQRGNVIERRTAEREVAALRSESGFDPALTTQSYPYRNERGQPAERPVMQSLQMDVGQAEMLTPEGTLHPRAARALARMDTMAREHGGDFSVFVPRSRLQTVPAIKEVAPGATIFETDRDEHYRLIVVAAER